MIPEITLTFTDEQKAQLKQAIQQGIAHQVSAILSRLPLPEVMFSFPQAAKLFSLHPETLRDYIKLPLRDSRRLRYVDCTGSARGQRITASASRRPNCWTGSGATTPIPCRSPFSSRQPSAAPGLLPRSSARPSTLTSQSPSTPQTQPLTFTQQVSSHAASTLRRA